MSQEWKGWLEHFQSVAVISSANLPVELPSITKGNSKNYRTLCSALFHSKKEMEQKGMFQLASLGLFQNCSRLLLLLLTFLFSKPLAMQLCCATGYTYLASMGKAYTCAKLTKARFVFMSKAQVFRLGKGSAATQQCLSRATLLKERNPGFILSVKSKSKSGWFCSYRNFCFSPHWESWPVPGLSFLLWFSLQKMINFCCVHVPGGLMVNIQTTHPPSFRMEITLYWHNWRHSKC